METRVWNFSDDVNLKYEVEMIMFDGNVEVNFFSDNIEHDA